MPHHVIYVPGLGDHASHGQDTVPARWSKYGVTGHYMPMIWNDKQSFGPKLQRLLDKIDELSTDGPVSLIGASAGASVVLLALAKRPDKVAGVVCICGKINHPETVSADRYAENPAFKAAMTDLQRVLPAIQANYADRILSIHPLYDGSVPTTDTIIPGAHNKTIPLFGHVFTIFAMVAFGSGFMIRFLKSKTMVR